LPQEQRHHQHHQHDADDKGVLHFLHRGADGKRAVAHDRDVDACGHPALQVGQQVADAVHHFQHIRVGLLEDRDDHRRTAVVQAGLAAVPRALVDARDAIQAHQRIALAPHDDGAELLGRGQPVVHRYGRGLVRPIDEARRLGDVGARDGGADLVEGDAGGSGRGGIDRDADGRLLGTRQADLRRAWHLRDARGEQAVRRVVDRARRHRVRGERQDQHRRIGRVQPAEGGRRGQARGQVRSRRIDRRLDVARGGGDRARQVELHDDVGGAEAGGGGEFGHTRDLAKPPFERCRDGRGHDDRIGARLARADRDGREIHPRQRCDREVQVGDDAGQREADRQQRGADRPCDEGGGDRHRAIPPVRRAGRAPWQRRARAAPPSPGRSPAWCRA